MSILRCLSRRHRGKPSCKQPAAGRKAVSSRFPSPCAAKGRTNQKCQNIHRHDGRTHRRPRQNGDQNAQHRAAHRQHGGTNSHGPEVLKNAHGGQRRKDHQRGDQQRADQIHRQHDHYGDDDGDQQIVQVSLCPHRLGKILVKGHGKNFVVIEQKHRHDHHGQSRAQPDLAF